jgi:hypothetical protein
MREITCGAGTRWRVEAEAQPAPVLSEAGEAAVAAGDGAGVALLRCVTCEGPEQFITIRAPLDVWLDMPPEELCALIAAAQRDGV